MKKLYQLYFTACGSLEVEARSEREAKELAVKIIREGKDGYIYADYDSIDIDVSDVDEIEE